MNFINFWDSKRVNLPFEIDGIVIKVNELSIQNEIGNISTSRWQLHINIKCSSINYFRR